MRFLLLLLPTLCPTFGMAQSVVAGAGGEHLNGNTQITYTIGEPITATVSAGGYTLTQGFQQPWADIGTLIGEADSDLPGITVYPNPVRHTLHIALDTPTEDQHYSLHDAAGRMVTEGRITGTRTDLDMEPYSSGGYVLRVFGANATVMKAFKISVTH